MFSREEKTVCLRPVGGVIPQGLTNISGRGGKVDVDDMKEGSSPGVLVTHQILLFSFKLSGHRGGW